MNQIERQVVERLKTLSATEQQEVLDFVEFLQSKKPRTASQANVNETGVSFLEAAERYIGCVEGPADLSTNPAYLEGYGT